MPSAVSNGGRIRTNTAAENAYNALGEASKNISNHQLRLSTGKRINSAADDVAGYITSRSLLSRTRSLSAALNAVGDAQSLSEIAGDALENIGELMSKVKESAASASSGAMGTDEKVALAKAAYRMAQQVQTVVDSTVFSGNQLLGGTFSAQFVIGASGNGGMLTMSVDLTTGNSDFNIQGASNGFDVNGTAANFAGVTGLALGSLNDVSSTDLGIFASDKIQTTLQSLSVAINNINLVGSYIGGIQNRMSSQNAALSSQITNYNAAKSRIEDADVAQEQLGLLRAQFLQQASVTSLAQANQAPQTYLQLLR